jgi:hypothetical protein
MPRQADNNLAVLRKFADHIVREDPVTRRVLFDLSYVPAPAETPQASAALIDQIRKIDMKRFLFGRDFNILTALQQIKDIDTLGLKHYGTALCGPLISRAATSETCTEVFRPGRAWSVTPPFIAFRY